MPRELSLLANSRVQLSNAFVICICQREKRATLSCSQQCIAQTNLIVPSKYILIILYEAVHVMSHSIWWINKYKITFVRFIDSRLEVPVKYARALQGF